MTCSTKTNVSRPVVPVIIDNPHLKSPVLIKLLDGLRRRFLSSTTGGGITSN